MAPAGAGPSTGARTTTPWLIEAGAGTTTTLTTEEEKMLMLAKSFKTHKKSSTHKSRVNGFSYGGGGALLAPCISMWERNCQASQPQASAAQKGGSLPNHSTDLQLSQQWERWRKTPGYDNL